ncbi:MAG: helix-turn-helix protein [Bacteroidota bacterium]|jgi:transcriptional regulator with XRE-family HTH domain
MAQKFNEKAYLASVGAGIRALRKKKKMTLEVFGDVVGLDKSNAYRIEKGRNITLLTLEKIARVFNMSSSKLLDSAIEVKEEPKKAKPAAKKAAKPVAKKAAAKPVAKKAAKPAAKKVVKKGKK